MRISDWSSDVCSSDLWLTMVGKDALSELQRSMIPGKRLAGEAALQQMEDHLSLNNWFVGDAASLADIALFAYTHVAGEGGFDLGRSEEHTSELQSLMRISYAVFCLKTKKINRKQHHDH